MPCNSTSGLPMLGCCGGGPRICPDDYYTKRKITPNLTIQLTGCRIDDERVLYLLGRDSNAERTPIYLNPGRYRVTIADPSWIPRYSQAQQAGVMARFFEYDRPDSGWQLGGLCAFYGLPLYFGFPQPPYSAEFTLKECVLMYPFIQIPVYGGNPPETELTATITFESIASPP